MTGIDSYSTTAATNATATGGSVNWAEGQAPSTVNNTARQVLTDIRNAFNDLIWFQYGTGDQGSGNLAVPGVYASGTSFTIAGVDVTSTFHTNRRVKAVGSLTGTIYGSISSSSFSTNTTVNMTWDSGSLSNETLTIYLSQIPYTGSPWPTTQAVFTNIYDGTAGHIEWVSHIIVLQGQNNLNYSAITTNDVGSGNGFVHQLRFTAIAPNNTTSHFLHCDDSGANRAILYSNGGLANYSANNVNLSDATVKSSYQVYDGPTLNQLEQAFMAVDWGRFKYVDQTHNDWNHGYTAQGVQSAFAAIAPELIDTWPDKAGNLKAVYHDDLKNIGMALLARALKRIAQLEAKIKAAGL